MNPIAAKIGIQFLRQHWRPILAIALALVVAVAGMVMSMVAMTASGGVGSSSVSMSAAAMTPSGDVSAAKLERLSTPTGEASLTAANTHGVPVEIILAIETLADPGLANVFGLRGEDGNTLVSSNLDVAADATASILSAARASQTGAGSTVSATLDADDKEVWLSTLAAVRHRFVVAGRSGDGDGDSDGGGEGGVSGTDPSGAAGGDTYSREAWAEEVWSRAVAISLGRGAGSVADALVALGYPQHVAAGIVAGHACALEAGLVLDVSLLAGIVFVESRGEWESFATGTVADPKIFGIELVRRPLDEHTTAAEREMFGPYPSGVYDHALGPMQFLAESWRSYGLDCDGDGVADPQNITDAAGGAAKHLVQAGNPERVALATIEEETAAAGNYNPGDRDRYSAAVMAQRNVVAVAIAAGVGGWSSAGGLAPTGFAERVDWVMVHLVGPQTDYSQCLGSARPQDPICTLGRNRFGAYPDAAAAAGVPRLLDCSGFVSSFFAPWYSLPTTTAAMAGDATIMAAQVSWEDAQPGDILLRRRNGGGHVALIAGIGADGSLTVLESNNPGPSPQRDGVYATFGWQPHGLSNAYNWIIRPSLLPASYQTPGTITW